MLELLEEFAKWLFPSPTESEPAPAFRWRQAVSLAIFLLASAVVIGDALAWGFFPVVFSGFASASQVHSVWNSQVEIRASQVERSILEARERQCVAQQQGNMDVLQFATQKLNSALEDFERAVKRPYRVPECSELVVGK